MAGRRCWNCNDPIPDDSFKTVCRACEQKINEEESEPDQVEDESDED